MVLTWSPPVASRPITLYLLGKPGVGKYTIAQTLVPHGFVICDNHLINNIIFSLLQYDGFSPVPENAWGAITTIRTTVLNFLAQEKQRSYILTNVLGDLPRDALIFAQVQQMAQDRGSLFVPVWLDVAPHEHLRRITQPERATRYKSRDPDEVSAPFTPLPIQHPHFLRLDITALTPHEAALRIQDHIQTLP